MTIPVSTLVLPATSDEYLAKVLAAASILNLSVTSWQEGDPSLTIFEIMADVFAARDAAVETPIVKGLLLDFAADPSVTPEPVRGVAYQGGWLDMTADQLFGGTTRIAATRATCAVAFVNSTGGAINYPAGTYHVQNLAATSTYSNPDAISIPPGSSTGFAMTCDVVGAGQYAPTVSVTPVPGLVVAVSNWLDGSDTESNAALVTRCRAKFQTLSSGGPAGAYDFFARTVPTETPARVTSGLRTVPTAPVTRTFKIDVAPGVLAVPDITMYVANAAGAYPTADTYTDSAALGINTISIYPTYVTVTTTLAHGYAANDHVYIVGTGVPGLDNTATNPTWTITNVTTYSFRVTVAVSGTYSYAATCYRVSDLDLVKRNLLHYCVPEGILVDVLNATNETMSIAWTAEVHAAGATQALVDKINSAIKTYVGGIDIGGVPLYTSGVLVGYGVPHGAIIGTIWQQDPINLIAVRVWLGGAEADWTMPVASGVIASPSPTPILITDPAITVLP